MGKSKGDYKRRNPVTREMIERHRNAVHMDKRERALLRMATDEFDSLLDANDYDATVDDAGNVNVFIRRKS